MLILSLQTERKVPHYRTGTLLNQEQLSVSLRHTRFTQCQNCAALWPRGQLSQFSQVGGVSDPIVSSAIAVFDIRSKTALTFSVHSVSKQIMLSEFSQGINTHHLWNDHWTP